MDVRHLPETSNGRPLVDRKRGDFRNRERALGQFVCDSSGHLFDLSLQFGKARGTDRLNLRDGLFVQDNTEKRAIDLKSAVIFDEALLLEFIHGPAFYWLLNGLVR